MSDRGSSLSSRAVFTDAARDQLAADLPIQAHDAVTGVDLHYRFEAHAGGVLRLTGGPLGSHTLAVGCDEPDLNLIATLLLDGLRHRPA